MYLYICFPLPLHAKDVEADASDIVYKHWNIPSLLIEIWTRDRRCQHQVLITRSPTSPPYHLSSLVINEMNYEEGEHIFSAPPQLYIR